MTIPIATLDLARASLGLVEIATDVEAFTADEWADALGLSKEKTRLLLKQGVFDSVFERKDVLRTMEVGSISDTYLVRDCYKFTEEE